MGSLGMLLREIPFNSFQMAFYASLKDVVNLQPIFYSMAKLSFLKDDWLLESDVQRCLFLCACCILIFI